MERLQTGQDRSSTSKVIRLNTVPAGQRYAMVMPSYFSRLSMLNATKPLPHHHDMQGKTILAFRRIVLFLAAITLFLFSRVLGADNPSFRPVMGKRGEAGAAAGPVTTGAGASSSG